MYSIVGNLETAVKERKGERGGGELRGYMAAQRGRKSVQFTNDWYGVSIVAGVCGL